MAYSYIEAIGVGYPTVNCHALGTGTVYTDIIWDSGDPIPAQATLDAWIAANPDTVNTKITVLAFRNRFTQTEKVTMDMASIDDPAASSGARQLAAMLRVMATDLAVATFVDLSRPDTIAGVQTLETYGIIGVGRANTILTSPIQPIEEAKV